MDDSDIVTIRMPGNEREDDQNSENENYEEPMAEERRERDRSSHDNEYDRDRELARAITGGISDVMANMSNEINKLRQAIERSHYNQDENRPNLSPIRRSSEPMEQYAGATSRHSRFLNEPFVSQHAQGDGGPSQNNNSQNRSVAHPGSKLGKMKPQPYDWSEDLDEYLTHFNIVAKLNGWNETAKSLHLAGSLTGGARALLNDLDPQKREDYDSLVDALTHRYGNVNRAAVFKTQLQTRIKRKDESIPELAQAIVKLARKAYPTANPDMIDVLAIDHFIDALPQADIRLKLKEKGPKNIMEADKLAVTLEAFSLADRQREKNLRVMEGTVQTPTPADDRNLEDQVRQLAQEVRDMKHWNYSPRGRGRPYNRRRGHNTARMGQDVRPPHPAAHYHQGNGQQARQGAAARPRTQGPE